MAVSNNKLLGLYDLIKAKHNGAYQIDGRILFLHDIEYVLTHSYRYRKSLSASLDRNLRRTGKE